MEWLTFIQVTAWVATAIGVLLAVWQIRLGQRQSRTRFEDELTHQYREIVKRIPVEALLGEDLSQEKYTNALDAFYRYFDLCNEQIFLRQNDRISQETWENWCEGIHSHLERPAFKRAWEEVKRRAPDSFNGLRKLEATKFIEDPHLWSLK